jgi:hypothetical protein
MRLSQVLNIVYSSNPEDWEEVTRGGNGPVFRDHFIPSHSAGDDAVDLDVLSHSGYAVYEPDADITIAWGIDPEATGSSDPGRSLTFKWAHFPDPEIHPFLVDLFYRGALVHRMWMLHVDGGRLSMPLPKTDAEGQYISERSVGLGRVVDRLDGADTRDFDATIATTGLPIR